VANYVLKKPAPLERDAIEGAMVRSLTASEALIAGAMDQALARIHAQPPRPKPVRRDPPSVALPAAETDADADTEAGGGSP
jgi:PTH1 family peptidyl-tRNA hydrolase